MQRSCQRRCVGACRDDCKSAPRPRAVCQTGNPGRNATHGEVASPVENSVTTAAMPAPSTKPTAREAAAGAVRNGTRAMLRFARPEDGPEFLALLERSRAHLAPWMPRVARGDARSFDARFRRMLAPAATSDGRRRLLACARDDGRIVGVASLSGIEPWPHLDCRIGYWLGTGETGKGLMRDAVAALVDHAFEDLALHRVAANILPTNRRSIALVESLRFIHEGLARGLVEIDGAWRDHEVWAVLSGEWRSGTLDRSNSAPRRA